MNYIKEIKEKKPIERIENQRLDLSLLKKRTNAKTPSGLMLKYMKQFRDTRNFEMAFLFQELYKQIRNMETTEKKPLIAIEIIEGWKGIDNIELFRGFENDFVIKSHTKNKDTGEVTTQTYQIGAERVNTLFFWIKKWKLGETHKCYDFAEKLGYKEWKNLWKERKQYFEKYYYPIKVLEALGIVKYSGKGDITRIK
ncbi:MAG TPA: hypothetical protein ENG87_02180 [Candidatus Pacearchaeota archaeon]|nr:hypothetical protein [Candidatus Pacearchaeota archaeon]